MTDIRLTLNAEMRRAYREGRKTQSRKPVNPQPPAEAKWGGWVIDSTNKKWVGQAMWYIGDDVVTANEYFYARPPFVVPGDTLLLLEPYAIYTASDREVTGVYLDTGDKFDVILTPDEWEKWLNRKYPDRSTSSRFMYNSLVRHRETVKRVWVGQIQNISIADIYAEGCPALVSDWDASELYEWFADEIWDPIYKPRGLGWDSNCWNWCLDWSKERIE